MTLSRRDRGKQIEKLVQTHLERNKLRLYEANFNCRFGEIDLIMLDGNTLVFVEVRYRRKSSYGTPMETVTRAKQVKIRKAAGYYLVQRKLHRMPVRFDVVAVSGEPDEYEIIWLKDAFT
ncbi:MAG: YraN family protein [Gammaproteobacteria bacterium]|nr:YraN family protein [Gammaproteobacteria bacterium]